MGVTSVPVILAETFRSLNACQRAGEGRFMGCRNYYWCGFIVTFGSGKGLLSGLLKKLLPIKGTSGYTKTR
ncbi:hypothetical protein Goklo_025065 [Gossypium klotzschianum]|uniref:Uncharacterized protein n=1 Tax=Gossypium klotzschianum TaxID=34286 RepID=A0A7J8WD02_9ROSI|nr:hypothetical protein [Gossypium klotzschianum]